MGHDVDTDFNAWKESLDASVEQESKPRKDVKTMVDIFRHLVSSSKVKSNALLV